MNVWSVYCRTFSKIEFICHAKKCEFKKKNLETFQMLVFYTTNPLENVHTGVHACKAYSLLHCTGII